MYILEVKISKLIKKVFIILDLFQQNENMQVILIKGIRKMKGLSNKR